MAKSVKKAHSLALAFYGWSIEAIHMLLNMYVSSSLYDRESKKWLIPKAHDVVDGRARPVSNHFIGCLLWHALGQVSAAGSSMRFEGCHPHLSRRIWRVYYQCGVSRRSRPLWPLTMKKVRFPL